MTNTKIVGNLGHFHPDKEIQAEQLFPLIMGGKTFTTGKPFSHVFTIEKRPSLISRIIDYFLIGFDFRYKCNKCGCREYQVEQNIVQRRQCKNCAWQGYEPQ